MYPNIYYKSLRMQYKKSLTMYPNNRRDVYESWNMLLHLTFTSWNIPSEKKSNQVWKVLLQKEGGGGSSGSIKKILVFYEHI